MTDLLPPTATTTEKTADAANARISDVPTSPIALVNDAANAPGNVLPHLAWAESVDVWDATWSEATRRTVIDASFSVHQVKGTPGAVEDAFEAAGYGCTIHERVGARKYDGNTDHDGIALYGPENGWAMYRIVVDRPIRNDQLPGVYQTLRLTGARRCHLVSLDYTEAANLYDGASLYDGAFNHGVAS